MLNPIVAQLDETILHEMLVNSSKSPLSLPPLGPKFLYIEFVVKVFQTLLNAWL